MLLTSYEFIGFLALVIIINYLCPKKARKYFLLAASVLFYATAGLWGLLYIGAITVLVYISSRLIGKNQEAYAVWAKENKAVLPKEQRKAYREKQAGKRLLFLTVAVILCLGVMVIGRIPGLIAPMGLSFYTLQALGYLIDVNRENIKPERNFFKLSLFIGFFPQLVQGPISRYEELAPSLFEGRDFDIKNISLGVWRIMWGFFKKLVIADRLFSGVQTITSDTSKYRGAYILVLMILFSLELYADFSGGIDIVIGTAKALGIDVQENFIRPYFSKSLKEYWRRWHITMCNWFRNYLFYSVSTAKWLQKFSKFCRKRMGEAFGKRLPLYVATFIVWGATGLWHGFTWNYFVWGLSNWFILMLSEELEPVYEKIRGHIPFADKLPYRLFQMGRTFLLVCCMNLFDCYSSVGDTLGMFGSIFTEGNFGILFDGSLAGIGYSLSDAVIIAAGLLIMLCVSLLQRKGSVRERILRLAPPARYALFTCLLVAVLLFGIYGVGYDSTQFIYNRF
ncbi:MAG: MBOAT family protein [Lachnospiraceae bacterium]|nr:MBOAT family protein [Lachnospiraceae bacterium]